MSVTLLGAGRARPAGGAGAVTVSGHATLTTSLESFWELDEASGTRVDAHGTNDLTDNNSVAQGAGVVGNCANFEIDSDPQSLSRADNASLSFGDEDFSACAWVKLESHGATFNGFILGKGADEYRLYYRAATQRFSVNVKNGIGGEGEKDATTLGEPANNTWYFIIIRHNATANTVSIQVNDGTVDSASYSGGCVDGTGAFHIGGTLTVTVDGLIDQVGLWRKDLSAQEGTDLYNAGAGIPYA